MRFAIFLSVIQSVLWLGHFFIYKTAARFLGMSGSGLWWLKISFFVLSIIFLAASMLTYKWYGPVARLIYQAAAVWLGTFFFLFLASAALWLVYLFSGLRASPGLMFTLTSILFSAVILVSAHGVWNSYQIQVTEYSVALNNLPPQWQGRKIVLAADTHLGPFRNLGFAKKTADLISAQNPDLVLFPGDFYDGGPAEFEKLAQTFGQIKSRHGVYFASGNHEEFREQKIYLQALESGGVRVLQNEKAEVDGLQLVGVDYASTRELESAEKLYEALSIDPTRASILLKHEPNNIPAAEKAGISLQVSGHAHGGGQIGLFKFLTKKLYGQFYFGHHSSGNLQVITTSGAGTWGPPQRVGTTPEIVVITLQ